MFAYVVFHCFVCYHCVSLLWSDTAAISVTQLYAEVNIKHASAHCVVPGCNGRRSAKSWLCNPSKSAELSHAGSCHDCKTTIHEF